MIIASPAGISKNHYKKGSLPYLVATDAAIVDEHEHGVAGLVLAAPKVAVFEAGHSKLGIP